MKAKARATPQQTQSARASAPAQAAAASDPGSLLDRAFLALSSERLTALLVMILCLLVGLTAIIPQGREALDIAEDPGAAMIHELARWGLTTVFESQWIRALFVLLLANLIAFGLRKLGAEKGEVAVVPPARADALSTDLVAALPERAVEIVREELRLRLGQPRRERVEGSRVSMVFDSGIEGRSGMVMHLGLVFLVVGAGLLSEPVPEKQAVVRAVLDVKDTTSGFVGNFDMVSNEPFTFFRFPSRYFIRSYLASKDGLGPAIRIERQDPSEKTSEHFWVYLNAPDGFDERHRKGEVAIRARKMALVPLPGQGVASSPASVVMMLGMGLVLAGLAGARRPQGRIWVDADGDRVTITGLPMGGDEEGFQRRFDRWVLAVRGALEE